MAKLNQQTLDHLLSAHPAHSLSELYPLSSTQQTMLRETLAAKESAVYFIQISLQLQGELNPAHFERSWQQVVEQHAIFRSAFLWQGLDNPLPLVLQQVKLPFKELDWRHLSPLKQEKELTALLQAEREQGFDLSQPPLMRCTLIQLAQETAQFVCSIHALLLDGWSLSIILKEVLAFYEALRQGEQIIPISPLSPLSLKAPPPYRDYIAYLEQQDLSKAKAFWKEYLKGFTTPTRLSKKKKAPALGEGIEQHTLQLAKQTTHTLQTFARQHHLTLNILIQGAWAMLLKRYTGHADVLFGATVSGRPADLPRMQSIVGQLTNSLPVRVKVPSKTNLLPWLQELMQKQASRTEYSYSPLEQIQACSELPQGVPLFESNIRFQNDPIDQQALQKWGQQLKIRQDHWIDWWHYPLNLIVQPGAELSLSLTLTYNKQYFESATIKQLLQDLKTQLKQYRRPSPRPHPLAAVVGRTVFLEHGLHSHKQITAHIYVSGSF